MKSMTETQDIENPQAIATLELANVGFGGRRETSIRLHQFTGVIHAGEMVQVLLESQHDPRDLVSLLIGLNRPQYGIIRFAGQDWMGTDYRRHFSMRSRIGRVYAGMAWMQNLTVRQNVQLSMLHHGQSRSAADHTVLQWTQRLSGRRAAAVYHAMDKRPAFVEPSVLQVCQFVRAVCNQPRLLFLERPLIHLIDELFDSVVSVIDDMRDSGTSVLWFASDASDFGLRFRSPVVQWSIVDDSLVPNFVLPGLVDSGLTASGGGSGR
jgi:ABC-type ATPase involved in cell division